MKDKLKNLINRIFRAPVFHKKPLYLALTIVLSILLLADVAMAVLVPDTGSMGNVQEFQNMQMPGSFDSEGSDSTGDAEEESSDSNSDAENTESNSDSSADENTESNTDIDNSSAEQNNGDNASDMGDGGMPDSSSFGDGEMPDGSSFGGGEMPDGSSFGDGEMPDMESGDAPSFGDDSSAGSADSSTDDSTDSSADPETSETGRSFDADDFANTQSSGFSALRMLQNIRSHWLLLLIILAILDAGSIFMLIRISRREKKQRKEEEKALREQAAAGEIVHRAQPAKKETKHSHYLWIIAVIVIILLVILVKIFTRQTSASSAETEATTYSEAVETGDIDTVLPGTGTLEEEDAEELSLPSEVEITEWYVSDGDTVEEGDTLAAVDPVSVMTAIASVQDNLASLDEALEDCEDDAISETITAAADGRVIKIYASADTSVVDTMYENNALMLLSLDGYMAVTIETDAEISTGDSVDVTLSDGTTVSGKVESLSNETAVIILSDDGPEPGDTVTVATEDGTSVGEGTLYIHSELKVTGYTGTVSSVSVSEGDEVDSGDTLLKLTDTDYSAEYETLLEQRSELEAQMKTLFQLYEDGYIYASCSGVISGLDSSSSDTDASSGSSSTGESSDASADGSSSSDKSSSGSSTSDDSDSTSSESASETSAGSNSGYTASTLSCTGGVSACLTINTSQNTDAQAVLTAETDSSSSDDSSGDDNTSDSGDSSSNETTDTTVQIGVVQSVSDSSVTLSLLSGGSTTVSLSGLGTIGIYQNGSYNASGSISDITEGDVLILTCTGDTVSSATCISTSDTSSENTDASTETTGNQENDSSGTSNSESDALGQADSSNLTDGSALTDGTSAADNLTGQVTSESDMTTEDASAMTATADTSSEAETAVSEALTEEVASTYGVDETTLLAITPQDTMTLEITVDEMDILSVEVGQEATITLDAFPGQSFTGTVTSINESGSNSGGSSKYTAVITMDREDDMLAGMNASAKITLSTTKDVLVIPEAALIEQDGSTYVYTSYDEETDTLSDLAEVTTGISDGTNVEITSGLEEGDTYCYSVLDVVNYSSSYATSGSSSFSIESLFGGGGRGGF